MTQAAAPATGKYVYGVVQAGEPLSFGRIGVGAEPGEVHAISYRNLAAIVSDVPLAIQDPTRENLLAHQAVTEAVMRSCTLVPVAFGTVLKSADDVIELLRSAQHAFQDVLVRVQGKVELGLKVLWDRDAVARELEREDEDLRRLKGGLTQQHGSLYFARMQHGRLLDAALDARAGRWADEILGDLRAFSAAAQTRKPVGERMILNAAFLVAREQEPSWEERLQELAARSDALTFRWTGPWPAYSFVRVRLKLERAG